MGGTLAREHVTLEARRKQKQHSRRLDKWSHRRMDKHGFCPLYVPESDYSYGAAAVAGIEIMLAGDTRARLIQHACMHT